MRISGALRCLAAPRFGVVRLLLALFMALALVTRIGLLVMHRALGVDGLLPVMAALGVGELFDFLAALWLLAPLTLILALLPERWFASRVHRGLLRAGLFVGCYLMLFVALAEWFFFAEFDGRFNFVAVDYLIYPTEVTVNLQESYPLFRLLGALLGVVVILAWVFRHRLRQLTNGPTPLRQRFGFAAGYAIVLAVLTLLVGSGLAHVSEDRPLNEIAGNGYVAFWQALMGQDAPYEGLYASRPIATALARLPQLLAEPATLPGSFVPGTAQRQIQASDSARHLNVVVVLEESLGSEFIGALQPGEHDLTPHFDSLAAEGTLLANAYSTGNRTIRAIEAITASLPPLPGISIVRRPASRDLLTLPALLRERGYRTMFNYGGRALFDGMGSYLRHNGVDRVIELKDYPGSAFRTAWGVADEVIFDRALVEMDSLAATGAPFYALVLSVSNHKPYAFPHDVITPVAGLGGRRNAVRYADYALGRFMRQARQHAFFDNTLFVLMGDHGARVYGAAEIPLPSYEVPILFYAPRWVPAGRRIATLASSLDVPPAILGILGQGYPSQFFGRDVLRLPAGQGRALMSHNNVVSVMDDSSLVVLGLHQAVTVYRRGDTSGVPRKLREVGPQDAGRVEDAISLYASADWLYRTGALRMERGRQAAPGVTMSLPGRPLGTRPDTTTHPPA